jgi:hypothetical protein
MLHDRGAGMGFGIRTGRWSVVVLSRNTALRLKIPRFQDRAAGRSTRGQGRGEDGHVRARRGLPRKWCWRASSKKSRAKPTGPLHHDIAMQTSRVHIGRQLLRARARVGCESVRTFSVSAPRGVKEPPPPPPPKDTQDGTTHFGFETIAEALKEQRGEHEGPDFCAVPKANYPHQSAASSPRLRPATTT